MFFPPSTIKNCCVIERFCFVSSPTDVLHLNHIWLPESRAGASPVPSRGPPPTTPPGWFRRCERLRDVIRLILTGCHPLGMKSKTYRSCRVCPVGLVCVWGGGGRFAYVRNARRCLRREEAKSPVFVAGPFLTWTKSSGVQRSDVTHSLVFNNNK